MPAGNDLAVNLADVNVARRLRFGIASLAVGLALAVLFDRYDAGRLLRLSLFVPFFLSSNAFFQGLYQTCGFSAFAGRRHTGCGSERIANAAELRSVRVRGRRQITFSILAAAALTASFVVVA